MSDFDIRLPATLDEHVERIGRIFSLPAHANALDAALGPVTLNRRAAETMTERQLSIEQTRLAPTAVITDFHTFTRIRELEYRGIAQQAERGWRDATKTEDERSRMLLEYQFANQRQSHYHAFSEILEEQRSFLRQYLLDIQTMLPLLPEPKRRLLMAKQREVSAFLFALNNAVNRTTRSGSFNHLNETIHRIGAPTGFLAELGQRADEIANHHIGNNIALRDAARTRALHMINCMPTSEQPALRAALAAINADLPAAPIAEPGRAAELARVRAGSVAEFTRVLNEARSRLFGNVDREGRPTSLGSLTRARIDSYMLLQHLHEPRTAMLRRLESELTARPQPAVQRVQEIFFQLRPHAPNPPADGVIREQTLALVRRHIAQQEGLLAAMSSVRNRRGAAATNATPENQRLQNDAEVALHELLSKATSDELVRGTAEENIADVFEADLGVQEHRLFQTIANPAQRPLGDEPEFPGWPSLNGMTLTPGTTVYFTHPDNSEISIGGETLGVRPPTQRTDGPTKVVRGVEYVRQANGQLKITVQRAAVDGERQLQYGPAERRISVKFFVGRTEEADIGILRVPPGVSPQNLAIDTTAERYAQMLELQTQTLTKLANGEITHNDCKRILDSLSKRREALMRQQVQIMGRLASYQERMAEILAFQNAFGQGRRLSGLIAGLPYNQLDTHPPGRPPPETSRMRQRRSDVNRALNVMRDFHFDRMLALSGSVRATLDDLDRARRDDRWMREDLFADQQVANTAARIFTSPLALPGMIPGVGMVTDPIRDALTKSIGDQTKAALETGPDGQPLDAEGKRRKRQTLLDLINGFDKTKIEHAEGTLRAVKGINPNLMRGVRLTPAQVEAAGNNTTRVPAPGDAEILRLISGNPGRELTDDEKTRGAILFLKLLKQLKEDIGDTEDPRQRKGVLGEYAWFLLETERILNVRLEIRGVFYQMANRWRAVMGVALLSAVGVMGMAVIGTFVGGAFGAALLSLPRLAWNTGAFALRSAGEGLASTSARMGTASSMLTGLQTYNAWQRYTEAAERQARSKVEIENALKAMGCREEGAKDDPNGKWVYVDTQDEEVRIEIPYSIVDSCMQPMRDESSSTYGEAWTATGVLAGQLVLNVAMARAREAAIQQAMKAGGATMTRRMAMQSISRGYVWGARAVPVIGIIINIVLVGMSERAKARKMSAIRKFMNQLPPALLAEVSWEGLTGADLHTFLYEHSKPSANIMPEWDTPEQRKEARERALFVYFEGVMRDKRPDVLAQIYAGIGSRFELGKFLKEDFQPVFLPLYYLILYRMCQNTPAFRHHTWAAISNGETVNGSHHIPKDMIERALETAAVLFLHTHMYEKQYREVAFAARSYSGADPEIQAALVGMERTLGRRRVMGGAMNQALADQLAALGVREGAVERPAGLPNAFVDAVNAECTRAPALSPTSTPVRLREANEAVQTAFNALEEVKRTAGVRYIDNAVRARGYRAEYRPREGGPGTIMLIPVVVTRMGRIAELIRSRGPTGRVGQDEVPGLAAPIQFNDLNIFGTWAAESIEDPVVRANLRRELAQRNMGSARFDTAYAANTLFWDVLNPEPIKRNAFYVGGFSGYSVRTPSRSPLPPEMGSAVNWTSEHIFGAGRLNPRSQIVFQTTAGDRESYALSSLNENATWLFARRYNSTTLGRSRELEQRVFPAARGNAPTVLVDNVRIYENNGLDFDRMSRQMLAQAAERDPSFSIANLQTVVMQQHAYTATKRIRKGMMVVHPLERISPRHTFTETNICDRWTFCFLINGQKHYVTVTAMHFQTPDWIDEDEFEEKMGVPLNRWLSDPNRPYRTVYDGAMAFNEQTFAESSGGYGAWLTENAELWRRTRLTEDVAKEADEFNYPGAMFRRSTELELEQGNNGPLVFLAMPPYMGEVMTPRMELLTERLLRSPRARNRRLQTDVNPIAICIEFPAEDRAIATYVLPAVGGTDGFPGDGRYIVRRMAVRLGHNDTVEEGAVTNTYLGNDPKQTRSLLRLFRTNERDEEPANPRALLFRFNRLLNERNTPHIEQFLERFPEAVTTAADALAARLRTGEDHAAQLRALNEAIVAAAPGAGETNVRRRAGLLLSIAVHYSYPTVMPNHRLRVVDNAITVVNRGSAEMLRDPQTNTFAMRLSGDNQRGVAVVIPGAVRTVSQPITVRGNPSSLIIPAAEDGGGDRVIIRRSADRVDISVTVNNLPAFMSRDDLTYIEKREVLNTLITLRQGETRRQQLERILRLFPYEVREGQEATRMLVDAILPFVDPDVRLPERRERAPDPQLVVRQMIDRLLLQRNLTIGAVNTIARSFTHEGGDLNGSPTLVFPTNPEGSSVHLPDGRRIDYVRLYDGRFAETLLERSVLQRGDLLKLHAPSGLKVGDARENVRTLDVGQERSLSAGRLTIRRLDPNTVEVSVAADAANGPLDLFAELPGERLVQVLNRTALSILPLSIGTPPLLTSSSNNTLVFGDSAGFYRPGERLHSPIRPGEVRSMSAPRGTQINGQLMDTVGTEKRIDYVVGTGDARRTGTIIFRREENNVITVRVEGAAYGTSSTIISVRYADTPRGRHNPLRFTVLPPRARSEFGLSSSLPAGVTARIENGDQIINIDERDYIVTSYLPAETLAESHADRWVKFREDTEGRDYVLRSGGNRVFLRMGQPYSSRRGAYAEYESEGHSMRFGRDIHLREVDANGNVVISYSIVGLKDLRPQRDEDDVMRSIRVRGRELLCAPPLSGLPEEANAAVTRIFDLALYRDSSYDTGSMMARRAAFVARIGQCLRTTPRDRQAAFLQRFLAVLEASATTTERNGGSYVIGSSQLLTIEATMEGEFPPPIAESGAAVRAQLSPSSPQIVYYRGSHALITGLPANARVRLVAPRESADRSFTPQGEAVTVAAGQSLPVGVAPDGTRNRLEGMEADGAVMVLDATGRYLGRIIFARRDRAVSAEERLRAETEAVMRSDAGIVRGQMTMAEDVSNADGHVRHLASLVEGVNARPPRQTLEQFRASVVMTTEHLSEVYARLNPSWREYVLNHANVILSPRALHIAADEARLSVANGAATPEGDFESTGIIDGYYGMLRSSLRGINDAARNGRMTEAQLSSTLGALNLGEHRVAGLSEQGVIAIETIDGVAQVVVHSSESIRQAFTDLTTNIGSQRPPAVFETAKTLARVHRYAHLCGIRPGATDRTFGNAYVTVTLSENSGDATVRETTAGDAWKTMTAELPELLAAARGGQWETIDALFMEGGRLQWLGYNLLERDRNEFLGAINNNMMPTTRVRFAYAPGKNVHTRALTIEESRLVDAAVEADMVTPERRREVISELVAASAAPAGASVDAQIRLLAAQYIVTPADQREELVTDINRALREGNRVVRVRVWNNRLVRALDVPRAADEGLLEDQVVLPLNVRQLLIVPATLNDGIAALRDNMPEAAVRPAYVQAANEMLAGINSPVRLRLSGETIERGPDAAVPEEPNSPSADVVEQLIGAWKLRPTPRRPFNTTQESYDYGKAMFTRVLTATLSLAEREMLALPAGTRAAYVDAMNRALSRTALRMQFDRNRITRTDDDPSVEDRPDNDYLEVPDNRDVPEGVLAGGGGAAGERIRANIDLLSHARETAYNRWSRVGAVEVPTFYRYDTSRFMLYRAERVGDRVRYAVLRTDKPRAENYQWEDIEALPRGVQALSDSVR